MSKKIRKYDNMGLFPVDVNEASCYEIARIPYVSPLTAKRIIESRKNAQVRYFSDLEKVISSARARAAAPYIDLKDKKSILLKKRGTFAAINRRISRI